MTHSKTKKSLCLILVAVFLWLPAVQVWGQDEALDLTHTEEEEPFYAVNVARSSAGATAFASTTSGAAQASGSYTPAALLDGDRSGLNWGNNGGWRCATADAYPDWVEVHFGSPKSISEIDVFTVQDNYTSPVTPTLDQTFTLYGITDFQLQYWDGTTWVTLAWEAGNRNVWSQFRFAPVMTTAVRLWITGALASYSRVTEIEVWGVDGFVSATLGSTQNEDGEKICVDNQLKPCQMMTSLHTAMTGARRDTASDSNGPKNWWPNWSNHLNWDYSHWRDANGRHKYGSQNLPLMAHAIALWIPGEVSAPLSTSVKWWEDFLDCQNGEPCAVINPQTLRFMKGTELLSNTYDAETTTTIAAVRLWALQHDQPALAQKATLYLLYTWAMYSLGAGKSRARRYLNRYSPNPQQCHPNYTGPFMALAGMRSTPSHVCADDRGPLLARALHWNFSGTWRGVSYLTKIYDFMEQQTGAQFVNAYGLSQEQRDICRAVIDPAALNPPRTESYSIAQAEFLISFLQKVRTVVPYHFVAWAGQGNASNQIRLTVMETNLNHNTAPTYAVRYDFNSGTDSLARILFPWSNKDQRENCGVAHGPWRSQISYGYARFLPRTTKPTSVEASSIDREGRREVAGCVHEDGVTITDTMPIPNWGWRYHYVLKPDSAPEKVTREP